MIRVTENFRKIQDLLAEAAHDADRSPEAVTLLAVSKKKPLEAILELAEAGQRDFGENFVQEGVDKISAAGRDDLIWHFIGPLQSNKTRLVAEHFHWVHSLDRLKIARRLSDQRSPTAGPLNVCIQVNVDREDTKSGVPPEDLNSLAREVAGLPRLHLRGLMCIPEIREDPDAQRVPFARLRELFEGLREAGYDLDTLSMGMTADFKAAIQEGATIVRIGTALFGART